MSSFLSELGNNSVITSDAVTRLKSYIARKSPDASVPKRAVILADALNRVLDSRLPEFNEIRCKRLKRVLLEHITKKSTFEIFCSDIFEAAVELKEAGEDFFDEMDEWLSSNLDRKLPRKQLVDVVLEAHELMVLRPELGMRDMLAAAEATVAASEAMAAASDAVPVAASAAGWTRQAAAVFTDETSFNAAVTTYPEETIHRAGVASTGYAAARLKAISRKASARMEYVEPESATGSLKTRPKETKRMAVGTSAGYAAARLKAISRKTSTPVESAGSESASCLEITSANAVFAGNRVMPVLRRHLNDWRRLSAAAAAVVLIFAGLVFGIGRLADRTANGAQYMTDTINRTENPYEFTVLAEEDVAAGINNAVNEHTLRMKATAYDLSVESCGKRPGEPGYGITSSGSKAQVGRTVAVDPDVVPLGSRLMITFPEEYSHLNGVYLAEDTGRLIKGSSIDIFFGEDDTGSTEIYDKAMEFGVRYVDVKILDDPEKDAS